MKNKFNPKYTFWSFLVLPPNQLAYAAASAVVQYPGVTFNPLFIFGRKKSGKTHLLHAIGNEIIKRKKNFKTVYLKGAKFNSSVRGAIRAKKVAGLIARYKRCDVLMIDGIDENINEREIKTQKTITAITDELYARNKQVVITSGPALSCIPIIIDHFRFRYKRYLITDIFAPKEITTKSGREKIEKYKDIFFELQAVRNHQREPVGEPSLIVSGNTWWSLPLKMGELAKTLEFEKEESVNEWRFYNFISKPIMIKTGFKCEDYFYLKHAQRKALGIMRKRYPNNFLLKNISSGGKLLSKKDIAKMLSDK